MDVPWLKVVNKTDNEVEIDIDGIIGWDEDSWPEIKKQLSSIAKSGQKKLIVNIYSPGGFVSDGLMIHDALKISKAKIETRVFSMTASAATLIAQSGDTRKMSSNALYLIHCASNVAWGNVNDMKAAVDVLEKVDERIKDIYIKKGADPQKIEELMNEDNGNGKWIDADEALEYKLIDEIIEPTRAAASVSKEFLDKYKLPQIPDNLMSKIEMIPVATGEAVKTEKTQSFLKGVLGSIKDFLGEGQSDDVNGQNEEKMKADKEAADKLAAEKAEAERIATEKKAKDEKAEAAKKEAEKNNPELAAINARLSALEAENAKLKADLSDAQTKLVQATAKSTVITGPTGKEGDETDKDPVKAEEAKTLNIINKVMNGGYLESPKPKK